MEPQLPATPPDPKTRVDNALAVTQSGEHMIFNIRRHPIGIFGVYAGGGFLLIMAAILCFVVPPQISSTASSNVAQLGALVFMAVALAIVVFLLISTKVYWGNQWILTSDSVTQINQNSLFSRQSSQLSLGNLEDVTAEQNGILPHMFNYGFVKLETAGETGKFIFTYCPNPNYYAQQIIAAREAYEQLIERERDHGISQQPAPYIPYPQNPPVPVGQPQPQPQPQPQFRSQPQVQPEPPVTQPLAPPPYIPQQPAENPGVTTTQQ